MFFILQVFTNISGLVLLDIEGNIESCNPHFVKILFGQSEMDLKGKVSYSLIFPTDYVSYSNVQKDGVYSIGSVLKLIIKYRHKQLSAYITEF